MNELGIGIHLLAHILALCPYTLGWLGQRSLLGFHGPPLSTTFLSILLLFSQLDPGCGGKLSSFPSPPTGVALNIAHADG